MTNNIAKIRAALEQAGDYISSDLASERGAFEGYEGVSRIDEIKADLANNSAALAALAELEKAAGEPVAWMWNDELGIPHVSAGQKKPVWVENGLSSHMAEVVNLRQLYTTPPPAKPAVGMFTADEMEIAYFDGYDDCYQAIDRKRLDWRAAWPDSDTFKLVQERTK